MRRQNLLFYYFEGGDVFLGEKRRVFGIFVSYWYCACHSGFYENMATTVLRCHCESMEEKVFSISEITCPRLRPYVSTNDG
jgi:hypothetical protein